jgi:hypothetical protein
MCIRIYIILCIGMNRHLFFLYSTLFFGFSGSRWPYSRHAFSSQLLRCNEIIMSENHDELNGEFLSLSPSIVFWHQITSLNISLPLNSTYLHFLFSQTTNLRTLELHYKSYQRCPWRLKTHRCRAATIKAKR